MDMVSVVGENMCSVSPFMTCVCSEGQDVGGRYLRQTNRKMNGELTVNERMRIGGQRLWVTGNSLTPNSYVPLSSDQATTRNSSAHAHCREPCDVPLNDLVSLNPAR